MLDITTAWLLLKPVHADALHLGARDDWRRNLDIDLLGGMEIVDTVGGVAVKPEAPSTSNASCSVSHRAILTLTRWSSKNSSMVAAYRGIDRVG